MTLPNKLTVGRIALTPVFFIVFSLTVFREQILVSGIILLWIIQIVSEVSDVLDGHIARKHNLVSDMGKIPDTLAQRGVVG